MANKKTSRFTKWKRTFKANQFIVNQYLPLFRIFVSTFWFYPSFLSYNEPVMFFA
jgi:hypothetical protein